MAVSCIHINEDGTYVINEDGGYNVLQECADAITDTATQVGSGPKDEINPQTRRYWENERIRLRVIADDEEMLVLT